MDSRITKLTGAGLLITLGIIYGDIGTSPLYTFQTLLVEGGRADRSLIYGAISCVFWTLTLQTTFKYIVITLQADNKGEGGIFSLYALVKNYGAWLTYPAIIGAGTLLADGIITPPISITSAIEGLNGIKSLEKIIVPGNDYILAIVIAIIALLFFFQQFGTKVIGSAFGPVMLTWFTMLGVLGISQIIRFPGIFSSLNPWYGYKLLHDHPRGFWLLGAVFLCTTGAEALYSDLGHCGRQNIRVTWIFVKITLVLNYMGQGAWVMLQKPGISYATVNPFFGIVPSWFLLPSIIIATMASVIASQALISGSFTLISEAVSMKFWPRINIRYPTDLRGQIYIPSINWILCFGCIAVELYFRTSERMTAAYGFSITVAMLMTTILVFYFMRYVKKWPLGVIIPVMLIFLTVETSFFIANAVKIVKRLFFLVFEVGLISTMYIWYNAGKITARFTKYLSLLDQVPLFLSLSQNTSVPKYASHLIYLTQADEPECVEDKIIYSIFSRIPKKADIYWFIHIDRTDEPYTMEYKIIHLLDDRIIRVEFHLGFRIQTRLNVLFRKVVEEMVSIGELDVTSKFPTLKNLNLPADFRFIFISNFLSVENDLYTVEGFILNSYFTIQRFAQTEVSEHGLDTSDTRVEKLPLVIRAAPEVPLKRIYDAELVQK